MAQRTTAFYSSSKSSGSGGAGGDSVGQSVNTHNGALGGGGGGASSGGPSSSSSNTAQQQQFDNAKTIKFILLGNSNVGKTSILNRYCEGRYDPSKAPTIGVDFKWREIMVDEEPYRLHIWDTAGQEAFKVISRPYYRQADGVVLVYDVTDCVSMHDLDLFIEDARTYCPLGVPMVLLGNKYDLSQATSHGQPRVNSFGRTHSSGESMSPRRSGGLGVGGGAGGGSPQQLRVGGGGGGSIGAGRFSGGRFSNSQPVGGSAGGVTTEEGERFARKRGIPIFFQTSAVDGTHIDEAFEVLCRHVVNNRRSNDELQSITQAHANSSNSAAGGSSHHQGTKASVKLVSNSKAEKLDRNRRKGGKKSDCKC